MHGLVQLMRSLSYAPFRESSWEAPVSPSEPFFPEHNWGHGASRREGEEQVSSEVRALEKWIGLMLCSGPCGRQMCPWDTISF